jgi:CheY-like chemotaxis protein
MANVLVVDDDPINREFLRTLLGYRGHRVTEAGDGDSALALASRELPDAVITDVLMPGLDGYELARTLRAAPTTSAIPIAFSTAHYDRSEIQPLARACGVQGVIFKPARPKAVFAVVDVLLAATGEPAAGSAAARGADDFADRHRQALKAKLLAKSEALAELMDRLAETQRMTHSGTWDLDPGSGLITLSPSLSALLGLPATTVTREQMWHRVHPDDVPRAAAAAQETARTGKQQVVEVRVAGLDGVVHELVVSCRATEGAAPHHGLWGVAQDITEIRDRERAALREQWERYTERRVIDSFRRAMLPTDLPAVPGVDLAAVHRVAPDRVDIGGDWHDGFPVAGGRVLLSVGRVAGHSQPAAAVMGSVRAVLRASAIEDPDPVGVLTRLNRFVAANYRDTTFATAVVALFDPATGVLHYANAGHPAPLIAMADPHGAEPQVLALAGRGPALGIFPDARFAGDTLAMPPVAALCLYTDGLTDRHRDPLPAAGHRLAQAAAGAFGLVTSGQRQPVPAARRLAEQLVTEMLGGEPPDGDATLAVLWPAYALR